MIKSLTHRELVSILMQIHDELPSRFFQYWIRVTINKLNSYDGEIESLKKNLFFYQRSFELIKETNKTHRYSRESNGSKFINKFLNSCIKLFPKND